VGMTQGEKGRSFQSAVIIRKSLAVNKPWLDPIPLISSIVALRNNSLLSALFGREVIIANPLNQPVIDCHSKIIIII
jgi:hypothetical protein